MNSRWQHNHLLTTAVAYLKQRYVLTEKGASKYLGFCITFHISQQIRQFFEPIGKTIGELDTCNFSIFEEMWKPELVSSAILILILRICVGDPSTSSPPLGQLLRIPKANLHTLIK